MTTLQQALDDKDTLVLDIEFVAGDKQARCPASLWRRDGGLLWADPGWPTSPSHAFHFFPGSIEGDGPWTFTPADDSVIRRIVIRDLIPGEQPATEEFLVWETFRAAPEGAPYDRAAAFKAAAAALGFAP